MAVIEWIPKEQGGRIAPPSGVGPPYYSAPAKFLSHSDRWHLEHFDLVVDRIDSVGGDPYRWLAKVYFRIEDAPHDWLESDAQFELYEGKKCVARGRVE